jgi:tetratricopeptide (TPR) repeat protein
LFLELDRLYEAGNVPPERRLKVLQASHDIVVRREESFLREIMVLVLTGEYQQAIEYLENNYFHAQEGRDEIHDVYVDAHLLEGIRFLEGKNPALAKEHFEKASEYPENLSVGRPKNDRRAPQVAYFAGLATEALGDLDTARLRYAKAADQKETSRWPETRFYQALCHAKLGHDQKAEEIFQQLIQSGKDQLVEGESTDFFAKFGEQATRRSRTARAHYLIGLGLLGLGNQDAARNQFDQATKMNRSHPWARHQLANLKRP